MPGRTDMNPRQSFLWPLRPLRPCGFSPLPSPQRPNGECGTEPAPPPGHPAPRPGLPGHGGALPGHGGALPGHGDALPGHGGALPGHGGALPGHFHGSADGNTAHPGRHVAVPAPSALLSPETATERDRKRGSGTMIEAKSELSACVADAWRKPRPAVTKRSSPRSGAGHLRPRSLGRRAGGGAGVLHSGSSRKISPESITR